MISLGILGVWRKSREKDSGAKGKDPGLFRGAFLEKEEVALGCVVEEEVAKHGKNVLIFKGAFGEMKVAGVPGWVLLVLLESGRESRERTDAEKDSGVKLNSTGRGLHLRRRR